MKTLTFEEILNFNPWMDEEEVGRIKVHFDHFGGRMLVLDFLSLDDVSAEDKLWTVLREDVIPAPILHEFACVCAEYVLSLFEEPDPLSVKAIEVKRAWLRGEATDEELGTARDAAWAASAAADTAAWAAEVAWYATYGGAAYWAASNAALYAAEAAYSAKEVARDASREAQVAYLIMTLEAEK